jgi:hypothetical protein
MSSRYRVPLVEQVPEQVLVVEQVLVLVVVEQVPEQVLVLVVVEQVLVLVEPVPVQVPPQRARKPVQVQPVQVQPVQQWPVASLLGVSPSARPPLS